VALFGDAGGFDQGNIQLAEEALLDLLAGVRQVAVDVLHAALIDGLAHARIGLVGATQGEGISLGQDAVAVVSRRGSGEEINRIGTPGGVLLASAGGDGAGNDLGIGRTSEARGAHAVTIVDELGGLFSTHHLVGVGTDPIGHIFSSVWTAVEPQRLAATRIFDDLGSSSRS